MDAAQAAYEAASCDDFFEDYYYQNKLRKCEKDNEYYPWCDEILCEDRGAKAQMAFEYVISILSTTVGCFITPK